MKTLTVFDGSATRVSLHRTRETAEREAAKLERQCRKLWQREATDDVPFCDADFRASHGAVIIDGRTTGLPRGWY